MNKSREAFRTISEVAEWLGTQPHVLRFWESKFSQVKPVKRAGGRRYYRPSDMALLGGIKRLLHDDGLTIKGAQKVLREKGVKYVASLSPAVAGAEDEVRADLEDAVIVPMGKRKSDEELGYLIKGLARDMKLAGEVSVEDLAPILARLKRVRDRLAVHEGGF